MITVKNEKTTLVQIENALRNLLPFRRWEYALDALSISIEEEFSAVGSPVDSSVGDCITIELDRFPLVTVDLRIDEKEKPIFDEEGNLEDFSGQWVFTPISFACSELHFWEEIR